MSWQRSAPAPASCSHSCTALAGKHRKDRPLLPALTLGTGASPELLQPILLPPQLVNKKSMRELLKSPFPLTSRGARIEAAFQRPRPARGDCAPVDEKAEVTPRTADSGQRTARSPTAPLTAAGPGAHGLQKGAERRGEEEEEREAKGAESCGTQGQPRGDSGTESGQPQRRAPTSIVHRNHISSHPGPGCFYTPQCRRRRSPPPPAHLPAPSTKRLRGNTRCVDTERGRVHGPNGLRGEMRQLGAKRAAADMWLEVGWWHRAGRGAPGRAGSDPAGADFCCPWATPAYGARARRGE